MQKNNTQYFDFNTVKEHIYDVCSFECSLFSFDKESKEYGACVFELNGMKIIGRRAKVTPKKVGQFVTLWKRINQGPIQPYDASDPIDFVVINIAKNDHFGQFVFPKEVLLTRGVFTSLSKEGKRALRVYPPWDEANNKQAKSTQKWQLDYFLPLDLEKGVDLERAKVLYHKR